MLLDAALNFPPGPPGVGGAGAAELMLDAGMTAEVEALDDGAELLGAVTALIGGDTVTEAPIELDTILEGRRTFDEPENEGL